jgi:hypothetical protein
MKLSFAKILFSKVNKLKNKSLTTLIRLELATKFNFPCMQQHNMASRLPVNAQKKIPTLLKKKGTLLSSN